MFKNANDQLAYLRRVGSHATKEHANGRIDAIPPNAAPPVEYFNTLSDQYKMLQAQYQPLVKEAATYRERLKQTLPYADYCQTQERYVAACEAISRIEQQFAELRPLIRAAREDAKAEFMWRMAKLLLQPHDVVHIEAQCELFAGMALEIPASLKKPNKGEMDGPRQEELAREEALEDRRKQARRSLEIAKDRGTVRYAGRNADSEPQQPAASPPVEDMMSVLLKQLVEKFNKKPGRSR